MLAPVDVVLCAHVVYTIADIEPFVRKLAHHARYKVVMPTHMRPTMARFDPFWPWIYGETKYSPPGAAALMQVLWEMDIYPQLDMFPPVPPRPFRSWERALETLRERLFVAPDTPQDARLQEAMRALLVATAGGYVIKDSKPGRLALISCSQARAWCDWLSEYIICKDERHILVGSHALKVFCDGWNLSLKSTVGDLSATGYPC
ncbi:MAG: hypothetical protein FJZ47_16225, partial [Candidatus Tectomicrobia bacterium]|nr:hypothetical protein [Candidatus Tectomicrobia bacterium]